MPRANVITTPAEIPGIGTIETAVLDFKARHKVGGDAPYERAKDIAAFANHLGGTILIGCADDNDRLSAHLPLSANEAATARRDYEKAARHLCVPAPLIVPHEVPWASGIIVAINVRPYPDRLIGVRHAKSPHAYTFPLRQTTNTIFLNPEEIAMYSDPRVRRALVLLSAIPVDTVVALCTVRAFGGAQDPIVGPARFVKVDEAKNAVVFYCQKTPFRLIGQTTYPVDAVQTVYLDEAGMWHVSIAVM